MKYKYIYVHISSSKRILGFLQRFWLRGKVGFYQKISKSSSQFKVFWHWLWMLNFSPKKVWKILPFLCSKLDYLVTWPAGPGVVWKREIWFFFFHTCESTEFFPSRPLEFFCGPLLPVRCWPASLSENGQNVKKCHNKNVKLCCYILDLLLCLLNTMAFKDFCW